MNSSQNSAEAADTSYADTQRALACAARITPFDAAAFLAMHRAVNETVTVDGEDAIYIYMGEATGAPNLIEMWAAHDWKERTPDWVEQVRVLLDKEKSAKVIEGS
ncbi:hypothetical protein GCM10007874_31650 [Labrys miyagiensis]|uniref:Uncharacterized protein n=1 Tax=Labrys miyagiensis TaxID=346912 RepID=A0ABQ6CIH0_9HYPH|nr:hypothetical protein [Labrys miyagiensis]GLS20148.1 hypothetical protein GCM10007874_31650 [Labrys miyagiensis]